MRKIFLCLIFIAFSQTVLTQIKIDDYGALISEDESGHLDNLVAKLREDSIAEATFVIYKDKAEPTGRFLRHFYGVKDFMIEIYKVSPEKLSIVFGGDNTRRTEIWLSQSKEEAAKFENKVLDETLVGKINRKTLFDYNCIDCDESPFINQFIFREGVDYLAETLKANPHTKAVIEIARVKYLSKTAKERKELLNQIFDKIEKKQIRRNKISIRFTSGIWAKFYIIPVRNKE